MSIVNFVGKYKDNVITGSKLLCKNKKHYVPAK